MQPSLSLSVTLPGTMYTSLPCSSAMSTVISVPLFALASTTTTASARPLTMRFLGGKFRGRAGVPRG